MGCPCRICTNGQCVLCGIVQVQRGSVPSIISMQFNNTTEQQLTVLCWYSILQAWRYHKLHEMSSKFARSFKMNKKKRISGIISGCLTLCDIYNSIMRTLKGETDPAMVCDSYFRDYL